MRAGILAALAVVLAGVAWAESPQPPRFWPRPPASLDAGELFAPQVLITPHPEIRAVVFEAWEIAISTDEIGMETGWSFGPLASSSAQQVDELNQGVSAFRFYWRPNRSGEYVVVARVVIRGGISYRGSYHRLRVH